ncbi:hypothetical protein [Mesorhizobium sp. M0060]|uniref:hypothetical protein n=1 Tax=Mesorhizobium sp. M0060 TaxID=2956866 RepID=UPI00333605E2
MPQVVLAAQMLHTANDWRLESFPTLAQAQGAASPTSLAAEVAGKVWLFTLGPKDGSTPDGTKVVEIGPLPPISASEGWTRISETPGLRSSWFAWPLKRPARPACCRARKPSFCSMARNYP